MSINSATPADWDNLQSTVACVEEQRDKDRQRLRDKWSRWCVSDDELEGMMVETVVEEVVVAKKPTTRTSGLPTDSLERKDIPVYTGFFKYFPRGIAAVAKLSLAGGLQHNQTRETLHWDREKSGDELDAMMRHMIDGDWDQVAWRAMANLEKQLEDGFIGDCKVK